MDEHKSEKRERERERRIEKGPADARGDNSRKFGKTWMTGHKWG